MFVEVGSLWVVDFWVASCDGGSVCAARGVIGGIVMVVVTWGVCVVSVWCVETCFLSSSLYDGEVHVCFR